MYYLSRKIFDSLLRIQNHRTQITKPKTQTKPNFQNTNTTFGLCVFGFIFATGFFMLGQLFFNRPTPTVASELLGKFLVRRFDSGEKRALMILETEAYDGPSDRASHASRGRTPRTEVMFGPPGVWYVYLVYGMHHMLNVVTGPEGYPAAVLIRALQEVRGPGRLTRELAIDRALNARPASEASGLWIEDRGVIVPRSKIVKAPRVGVDYAGPVLAGKNWNYSFDINDVVTAPYVRSVGLLNKPNL